nr:hypothetical protein [Tanacetum cinerariifolium]
FKIRSSIRTINSILSDELSDANFEENPLIPRPPPKPPDVETDAGEEIAVVMIDKDKFDDDYQIFMFDKFCESPIEIVIFQLLSLRMNEFKDRVELTTQIIPQRLKLSCVGYVSGFQDLNILRSKLVWGSPY